MTNMNYWEQKTTNISKLFAARHCYVWWEDWFAYFVVNC